MPDNSTTESRTSHDDPFGAEAYRLESCSLKSLGDREAEEASRLLAAMEPWKTLGYTREQLERYLLRPDPSLKRFAVLASGAAPAGILCLRFPWLLGAYIETIALFDAGKGHGTGRALIDWVAERIRPASRNLWALVSAFNQPAREFYARAGFEEIAPLPDLVKPGCDEILLRKRLR